MLVERGLAESRTKAQAAIMAGRVYVNGVRAEKPGTRVHPGSALQLRQDGDQYVSRGGYKLKKALEEFRVEVKGRVAIDVGASTGGCTDCLIQEGARRVYAVDVGYGQLAWKLRTDPRVVVMERVNARYMSPEHLPESPDLATVDVSFISLEKVLPALRCVVGGEWDILALVKPQFEAGRGQVGKKGVVKDPEVHAAVLLRLIRWAAGAGFSVQGLCFSPITGPEGNIEFWLHLVPPDRPGTDVALGSVERVVSEAHLSLVGSGGHV